jgi:tetratricopeptide (TPR) repeat protein
VTGPRQARRFAEAVHARYQAGDYASDANRLRLDVGEGLAYIDRASKQATRSDQAELLGWRGLLLIDAGQAQLALADFERSFALEPNLVAGKILIMVYGDSRELPRFSATCRATCDAALSDQERLDVIALCRQHSNAASERGEVAWMTPAQLSWYGDAQARQEAEAEQQARRQARQQRREDWAVRQMQQCSASCKIDGLRCQRRCGNVAGPCDDSCVESNHACLDQCEAAANQSLGR